MVFQENDFVNWDGTMIVRECQNANIIDTCRYSYSYFSKPTSLSTMVKVAIKMTVPQSTVRRRKWYLFSCLHILPDQKCQGFLKNGLNLVSELMFLQSNWLDFFIQNTQYKAIYLCWNIPLNLIDFSSCSGILMDQKFQKMSEIILDTPIYLNS